MKTDISLDALSVIMESANFNLDIGDNAKIDIGQAVDYIKSGEAEIEAAVQTKTAAFNLNAQSQITEFNTNALLQTQNFDNHIEESLNLAKQWAIGLPNEPEGNSAKYWAEQSAFNLNNKQDKIPAGNAGEVVIYSGINGVVGSTTMPIVNDATLTIQKNSATVGSFTSNAVDDKIINISVPTQASDVGAQETLVSGINIKTINSNSLLESGDVKSHEIITSTISNCITEIPQDIKLELNDGTLTLKAGSKVYVPNGFEDDGVTPKFDEVVISTDKTLGAIGTYTGSSLLFFDTISESLIVAVTHTSETTAPTSGGGMWYDTTNNFVRIYSNGVVNQSSKVSLPIAIATRTNGVPTSIDQVFNGFGYIGSTVFALPGVKGLIPDGRNDDGSLRNIEFEVDRVLTRTSQPSYSWDAVITVNDTGSGAGFFGINDFIYNKENSFNYFNNVSMRETIACKITQSSGKITSLTPKLPFRAVDYNDSSWVSAQAMPSGKYIDLTLGASGSSYTAPANGWFTVSAWTTATATSYIHLVNTSNELAILLVPHQGAGYQQRCFIPAKKGDVVKLVYGNLDTSHSNFKFIYAEGEN